MSVPLSLGSAFRLQEVARLEGKAWAMASAKREKEVD
jgi:hypothetical protein